MRSTFLMIALAGMLAASGSAAVIAQPVPGLPSTVLPAPVGHFQPRALHFSPQSAPEQAEQRRMSVFDAEQQKLDQQLDKALNICRC
jgi:hypothetical protein